MAKKVNMYAIPSDNKRKTIEIYILYSHDYYFQLNRPNESIRPTGYACVTVTETINGRPVGDFFLPKSEEIGGTYEMYECTRRETFFVGTT